MWTLLPEKGKRTTIMYVGLGIAVLAGGGFVYKSFFYHAPDRGNYTTAQPAHGMAGAETHPVKSAPLQVYDKKKAAKEMKLPEEIIADPREVTATALLPPSDGGYTVAAVTDVVTGKTELIKKEEERPLFGFGGKTEIGALVGVTSGGDAVIGYVRQDLLRIGPINLAGAAGAGVIAGKLASGGFFDISGRW